MLGDEVVEIEGPEAYHLIAALHDSVTVRITIKTERGYRVGIADRRGGLTNLGNVASGLVRFTIRPATLDDVYFARTQGTGALLSGSPVQEPA